MLKFSQMPYKRPDLEDYKARLTALTGRLKSANDYNGAKAAFLEMEDAYRQFNSKYDLAQIRHTIDTRDKFYDGEISFWNAAGPELKEYYQAWNIAMLESPFRPDFPA